MIRFQRRERRRELPGGASLVAPAMVDLQRILATVVKRSLRASALVVVSLRRCDSISRHRVPYTECCDRTLNDLILQVVHQIIGVDFS